MPRVHDRGSFPTDEPVERAEHDLEDWERNTHALVILLREHDIIQPDELRRGIEALSAEEYLALSYYERWTASVETLLVERNVLTTAEIDARVRELEERGG